MVQPLPPTLPDLSGLSLAQIAEMAAARHLPPVDSWNPARRGDSGMRIARDGTWYHDGDPIRREAMVRLFATILRREADGGYALVTPAEALTIAVEDLPLRAVEMTSEGSGPERRIAFRLDSGDLIVAGPEHPLSLGDDAAGQPDPRVHVRGPVGAGIAARIVRPVFYDLVAQAMEEGADPPAIWSDGARFVVGAA